MALQNARPLRWPPKGVSDALDGAATFKGAMLQLSNLVPDPTTDDSWVPRPAAVELTTFSSFTTPGFVSGLLVVGDIAYGMIASGRNAGNDEPFVFNLATRTFLTVSGITAANTPASPPSVGTWTPPILAQIGTRIIVTHPGFPGGATKFGWFDIGNLVSTSVTGATHSNTTIDGLSPSAIAAGWQPGDLITGAGIPANTTLVSINAAGTSAVISQPATATASGVAFTVTGGSPTSPLWGAGDTNINNLPSVPVGVALLNGRAYFACGVNGIPFSDALLPCNRTNATQALTTNDGIAVTALGPLGIGTTTGGIVQSLIAFQGVAKMQQITGDPATLNLSINALPYTTGTTSPLSLIPFKGGLGFVSGDGMRIINLLGQVSDPIGDAGAGISAPFINASFPSRICAAISGDTIRIAVINGSFNPAVLQEWDYDHARKVWFGPHTFAPSLIQQWRDTFLMAPSGVLASLWQSDIDPSLSSTYVENGTQLSCVYQTALLPDDEDMMQVQVVEMDIMLSTGSSNVTVTAVDDAGNFLDSVIITGTPPTGALWDQAIWDQAFWDQGASNTLYRLRACNWHVPLNAKQFTIQAGFVATQNQRIGRLLSRYQRTGYLQQYY